MAKVLANEPIVSSMLQDDYVLITVGGSVRRIQLDEFMNAINQGDEFMLRQVAWGVPLKETSNTYWGRLGNLQAWEEYKSMCGRFLVTDDGRAAKLHPDDSTIYADGTPLDESKGNVMHISPRLYYRVQEDNITGIPTLWMSHIPIGGHFIGNANNGLHNVVGAYKSYRSGTKLVSRKGYAPTGSRTITQNWTDAQAIGSDWGLQNYKHRQLMTMFLLSEFGDSNAQKVIGSGLGGNTNASLWGQTSGLLTGATSVLGDNFGKIPVALTEGVDTCRVNLMGIEDPYNWQWEQVQGAYFGNSENAGQTGVELFLYEGNRLPTQAELDTKPSGKYRQISRMIESIYPRNMILGEYFDIIPKASGGSSNTYWASYGYNNSTGQLFLVGGNSYNGANSALVYVNSNNAFSNSNTNRGSRNDTVSRSNSVSTSSHDLTEKRCSSHELAMSKNIIAERFHACE